LILTKDIKSKENRDNKSDLSSFKQTQTESANMHTSFMSSLKKKKQISFHQSEEKFNETNA